MSHVVLDGVLNTPVKVTVVAATFNEFIVDKLVEGALRSLQRNGVDSASITLVHVPGAFEIPLVVKAALARADCDGVVAVGAVIRGATPHFDYVAGECSKGIMQMALHYGKPVGNGVLTVDTIEQAIERAGTKAGNKGAEAAAAMLETLGVLNALGTSS